MGAAGDPGGLLCITGGRDVCSLLECCCPNSGNVSLNKASGGDRSLLIFEELSSLQLFT